MTSWPIIPCLACLALGAQSPLQVDVELPKTLDLRQDAGAELVPRDARDPAQVEAAHQAWSRRVAPLAGAASLRILLPAGPDRLPLLLAAAQALKAQDPAVTLYLAFDPQAAPLWDESAWGAVQGGALIPSDLGLDHARWRELLRQAQTQFPGRAWTLWLPSDPGPDGSELLGDGGRLVVPSGGPSARLAAMLPGGFSEVEGGPGDLVLRSARSSVVRRWRFLGGEWVPAPPPTDRQEVNVTAQAPYDIGALLGRMRASQLAERVKARTRWGKLEVALHLQAAQGPGADLGLTFRFFEAAGEPEETLQEQVSLNGMKAKLHNGLQLPIVESRSSLAAPVALNLTERYRYRDGGPGGPGQRKVRFDPVDGNPLLYSGELLVQEADGRILEERSQRSGLPGTVKSEQRILSYGEAGAGTWRVVKARSFERWLLSGSVSQVQRTSVYSGFHANDPGFDAARQAARDSDGTMMQLTVEGNRYFNKQKDGTRKAEEQPRSSVRALAVVALADPALTPPVAALPALAYLDFNGWGRGIQINALIAVVFNMVQLSFPQAVGGFDFSLDSSSMFLTATERPTIDGRLQPRDGVGRKFGTLNLTMAHDLGAGFRFQGSARYEEDVFSQPAETKYRTPGFTLPPSGLTRELRGAVSWLRSGFQLRGYYGRGHRPEGVYGPPPGPGGALEAVPDDGQFQEWGGSAGYDYKLGLGAWLHGETGYAAGKGFDRFKALSIGGLGGDAVIAGIRTNAIAADRLGYAKAGVVLPSGPDMRLTLSLDHAEFRCLDDPHTRYFTGLGVTGDLPGFGWFTSVRVNLGGGLLSNLPGVRSVNGYVAFLRVF